MSRRPLAPRTLASDLRGFSQLAIDGVGGVTDVVEAMHATIASLPAPIGGRASATTAGLTGFVYRRVRDVTRLVGTGLELSMAAMSPVLGLAGGVASPGRDALVAAVNGVFGDHLEASGNPLAIPMRLRRGGLELALEREALAARFPRATGRLLVQVHGLCMSDRQWKQAGHDHGEAAETGLGYSAVHLHYNSGRRVPDNGREFAELLEQLLRAWPVPIEELALLCHSMGGLVARSAMDIAFERELGWSKLPLKIIFLGTPHHGAPLERAGSWVDQLVGISPYSAPFVGVGQARSAGIQDLRHGNVRDGDGMRRGKKARADHRSPMPLPKCVGAFAIAGSRRADAGDGLVCVASALGEHSDSRLDLGIPRSRQWLGKGINHMQLLGSSAVYRRIARWLA